MSRMDADVSREHGGSGRFEAHTRSWGGMINEYYAG